MVYGSSEELMSHTEEELKSLFIRGWGLLNIFPDKKTMNKIRGDFSYHPMFHGTDNLHSAVITK